MPGASGSSARLRRVTSALHRDARSSSTFRRDCAAADSSRKFCIVRDDAGWRQYITRLTPMFDAATAVPHRAAHAAASGRGDREGRDQLAPAALR